MCRFLILVLSIVLKSVFVHMLDHFKATVELSVEYNTPCIPELFCLAQDRIDCISMQ